jgi:hypothetical protein
MVKESFGMALDQGFQIPELVGLHEICVVVRQEKIGIVFEKDVGDVVQMDQAVKFRRAEFVLQAKLIAKQTGGLVHGMDQLGIFWSKFSGVMIDDDPVWFVQPRLKCHVADPGGFFRKAALTPIVVVIRLQRHVNVEQCACQPTEQKARQQTVQVALVGQDHFGFR